MSASVAGVTDQQGQDEPKTPLPIEPLSNELLEHRLFPEGEPTPDTPFGAAHLWWQALMDLEEFRPVIEMLSVTPEAWNGYTDVARDLAGWSICSGVHDSEDEPGRVAYIKFIPDGDYSSGRVTAQVPVARIAVLTLVKCEDGWWRARTLEVDD